MVLATEFTLDLSNRQYITFNKIQNCKTAAHEHLQ